MSSRMGFLQYPRLDKPNISSRVPFKLHFHCSSGWDEECLVGCINSHTSVYQILHTGLLILSYFFNPLSSYFNSRINKKMHMSECVWLPWRLRPPVCQLWCRQRCQDNDRMWGRGPQVRWRAGQRDWYWSLSIISFAVHGSLTMIVNKELFSVLLSDLTVNRKKSFVSNEWCKYLLLLGVHFLILCHG